MTWPSRRGLITVWLVLAVGLGGLLILARVARTPLDDADPAYQRPGILDLGQLPQPAPAVTKDIPAPGEEAVTFFVRPDQLAELCRALTEVDLDGQPEVAVVVAGPVAPCSADAAIVADPGGRLADAYGLRVPQGGGASVGYAVVDESGWIRYRTLDPEVADLLGEVETILRAL